MNGKSFSTIILIVSIIGISFLGIYKGQEIISSKEEAKAKLALYEEEVAKTPQKQTKDEEVSVEMTSTEALTEAYTEPTSEEDSDLYYYENCTLSPEEREEMAALAELLVSEEKWDELDELINREIYFFCSYGKEYYNINYLYTNGYKQAKESYEKILTLKYDELEEMDKTVGNLIVSSCELLSHIKYGDPIEHKEIADYFQQECDYYLHTFCNLGNIDIRSNTAQSNPELINYYLSYAKINIYKELYDMEITNQEYLDCYKLALDDSDLYYRHRRWDDLKEILDDEVMQQLRPEYDNVRRCYTALLYANRLYSEIRMYNNKKILYDNTDKILTHSCLAIWLAQKREFASLPDDYDKVMDDFIKQAHEILYKCGFDDKEIDQLYKDSNKPSSNWSKHVDKACKFIQENSK